MNQNATDPSLFVSTTDAASENQLARDLGYPETWHVVRQVPHPADRVSSQSDSKPSATVSWVDTIYTGDPRDGVDVYYNHSAALGAMVNWENENSTGFDANGGQALPRKAKFSKGDTVEVLDEDSQTYHKANITKVRVYANDIRYTVFYPKENATQAVSEELLRLFVKPPPKRRKKSEEQKMGSLDKSKKNSGKRGRPAAEPTPTKRKRGRPPKNSQSSPPSTSKRGRRPMHSSYEDLVESLSDEEHRDAIALAKYLGLPENWLAKKGSTYAYTIWSYPDFHKFLTKKAAYDHLGWSEKEIKENIALKREGEMTDPPKGDLQEDNSLDAMDTDENQGGEEDDPPFRRGGHKFIGCRVLYKFTPDEAPDMDLSQAGTVTGWLDATDVDSKGEPAFLSETTGQPAKLFHVDFDPIGQTLSPEDAALHLEYVDMEEWELEKVLISSNEAIAEKEELEDTKPVAQDEDVPQEEDKEESHGERVAHEGKTHGLQSDDVEKEE